MVIGVRFHKATNPFPRNFTAIGVSLPKSLCALWFSSIAFKKWLPLFRFFVSGVTRSP